MKKRFVSAFLLVLMILTTVMPAAQASEIQPRYIGISQVTVSLDIDSTVVGENLASCLGFVALYDGYSADVKLSLQRSTNKTSWTNVKSWEASGEEEVRITEEYFVLKDYYYRVNILVYVYYESGSLAEIVTKNSAGLP